MIDQSIKSILNSHARFLILSPHLDDAGLSIPALIKLLVRTKKQILCLNAFTVSPYAPGLRTKSVKTISAARKKEDVKALKFLGKNIRSKNLNFLDAPLRGIKNVTGKNRVGAKEEIIIKKLVKIISEYKNHFIIAPLGILHIDHVTLAEAVLRMLRSGEVSTERVLFYEELPVSGAAEMAYINSRARHIGKGVNRKLKAEFITQPGMLALKKKMASFYPSQLLSPDKAIVIKHTKRLGNRERVWL